MAGGRRGDAPEELESITALLLSYQKGTGVKKPLGCLQDLRLKTPAYLRSATEHLLVGPDQEAGRATERGKA